MNLIKECWFSIKFINVFLEYERTLDKIKVIVFLTLIVVQNNILYLVPGHFSFFMELSLKWSPLVEVGISSENQLSN